MSEQATGTGIGQPVRRREDLRLLTGRGNYTDDLSLPGQAYAAIVRSPHAHAVIRSIDTEAARAVPGVIAVLTGRDWVEDGLKPTPVKTFSWHPAEMPLVNTDGSQPFTAPDFPLPSDKARFVGEALAIVVGGNGCRRQGRRRAGRGRLRAAGLRDVCARCRAARRARCCTSITAPTSASTRLTGDGEATAAAFARASACRQDQRPGCRASPARRWSRARRSANTTPPPASTRSLPATARSRRLHGELAVALGVADDKVRLVIRDVGGNFGTRGVIFVRADAGGLGRAQDRPSGEMDIATAARRC